MFLKILSMWTKFLSDNPSVSLLEALQKQNRQRITNHTKRTATPTRQKFSEKQLKAYILEQEEEYTYKHTFFF